MRCCLPVLLALLAAATATAGWECVGPEGGPITHLARSTVDDHTLYALSGTYPFRVLRSEDDGQSWETVGSCNGYPYGMDVGAGDAIWVGGSGAVYVSDDGGYTWTTHYQSYHYFYSIAADPNDPDVAHACGYVYDSGNYNMAAMTTEDGGAGWDVSELASDARGRCIAVSPADTDLVLAGGYVTGSYDPVLYLSDDGGASYTDVTPPGCSSEYYMQSVGFHPTNPDRALAGTYYGVWLTTDGCSSWTQTESQYYNYTMDHSPVDTDLVFAGGYNGVYRSTDGGQSFSSYSSGLSGNLFESTEVSPADATLAYAANEEGFFRSTDMGITWEASNSGIIVGEVLAYTWHGSSSTLYKSMVDLGIYKTDSYGSGWEQMNMPMACGDVCGIAVSPTDPDLILALEGDG